MSSVITCGDWHICVKNLSIPYFPTCATNLQMVHFIPWLFFFHVINVIIFGIITMPVVHYHHKTMLPRSLEVWVVLLYKNDKMSQRRTALWCLVCGLPAILAAPMWFLISRLWCAVDPVNRRFHLFFLKKNHSMCSIFFILNQ